MQHWISMGRMWMRYIRGSSLPATIPKDRPERYLCCSHGKNLGITHGSRTFSQRTVSYTHLDVYKRQAITEDGTLVTAGGRVLGVTATGPRLTNALSHAYEAAEKISFEKLHKRSDIGLRALKALAEKE